eukprot:jgi/Hompol1/3830/HPOL_006766-RA
MIDIGQPYLSQFLIDVNPGFLYRHHDPNNVIDFRVIDTHSGLFIDGTGLAQLSNQPLRFTKRNGFFRSPIYHKSAESISCKSPHHYEYEEIFPLVRTLFEGVETWRPMQVESLLTQEYPRGTSANVYFELYQLYIQSNKQTSFFPRTGNMRRLSWVSSRQELQPGECAVVETRDQDEEDSYNRDMEDGEIDQDLNSDHDSGDEQHDETES